jgi:SAM-dependent methyltransferase
MNGDYQKVSARHLLEAIYPRPQAGDKTLDIGCGTGIALFQLHELYPEIGPMVGFDLSAQMLSQAVDTAVEEGIMASWVQGDAHHLPFQDEYFDLVICHNAFHWFNNRPGAILEMRRVLKPGGRVALLFEGAGARQVSLGIRQRILEKYGLKPPPGYGPAAHSTEAWNTIAGIETLLEETGLLAQDIWVRQSFMYLPVQILQQQFRSTSTYWANGLGEERVNTILAEIESELKESSTSKGFREILMPLNVLARKPEA